MEPNEEYPTASILLRFASKQSVNVSEVKHKQTQARHEISSQAKALTQATRKEAAKKEQLEKARTARQKKAGE